MGSGLAARQVLRWTVRNANAFRNGSLLSGRSLLQPLCIRCRCLCSSIRQTTLTSEQEPAQIMTDVTEELSLRSLNNLGFTVTQAEQILESVSKARTRGAAKHCLSTLTRLFVLGLNPQSVLKLLMKCPDIYTIKESVLQQRISNLQKLGLGEGSIQRVVAHYPAILTASVKTIKQVVTFLKDKCLFTVHQVKDIIQDCPSVVHSDLGQLEYKFQYVYFRMGVKQAEMVKSRLFRFTLNEVRCRHSFLQRRGLYQTPDKKGQTSIINPKLESILNIDQETFLMNVANASAEEYDVFQRLIAKEWLAEHSNTETDWNYEEEEEEEEDEEFAGKNSYRKRKNK